MQCMVHILYVIKWWDYTLGWDIYAHNSWHYSIQNFLQFSALCSKFNFIHYSQYYSQIKINTEAINVVVLELILHYNTWILYYIRIMKTINVTIYWLILYKPHVCASIYVTFRFYSYLPIYILYYMVSIAVAEPTDYAWGFTSCSMCIYMCTHACICTHYGICNFIHCYTGKLNACDFYGIFTIG